MTEKRRELKCNRGYMCTCVWLCVRVSASMCASERACVCMNDCLYVDMYVCTSVRTYERICVSYST